MNGFPPPRIVDAGGVRLAVHDAGHGPAVVLVHGWPEIAYSWKNQMPAVAGAGFRAIAPDLKGFGGSEAPKDKALYDIRHVTDDLARLLDALSIDRAVFVGHDWGGLIVWPMAQLHADRVAGVVGVCTPHLAPRAKPPITMLTERFGPNHYIVRFQKDGDAEACFTGREDTFFEFMFRGPAPRAVWPKLIPGVFDVITHFDAFKRADPAHVVVPEADRAVYA
ncbi:MAG: alpha/beta hydrolase, partial [Parvularculaceae bacterium]|nr:alpha/beta hydrolase [Parvularculaceae bacterium]